MGTYNIWDRLTCPSFSTAGRIKAKDYLVSFLAVPFCYKIKLSG